MIPVTLLMAALMSAQAETTDDKTINPKESRAIPVTDPPNHRTSPYAMRMIVRFLKIV